jgi:hypothetical protein
MTAIKREAGKSKIMENDFNHYFLVTDKTEKQKLCK